MLLKNVKLVNPKTNFEDITDIRYIETIKHLLTYINNTQKRNLSHLQKVVIKENVFSSVNLLYRFRERSRILPAALEYHACYLGIELYGLHQVLYVQVHAVAPVVTGIGGNVDAFRSGLGQAHTFVACEPVLEGKDAQGRGAVEMALQHVLSQPSRHGMGCGAFVTEILVVETLYHGIVLVPPHAHGGAVVTGNGANAAPWIAVQYAEAHTAVLGHGNEFQRQYLQLVQHPRHTIGHHAQVLGANQHVGGIDKQR